MKSNERIVSILIRLLKGESIYTEELISEYSINKRTLQRDVSIIKKTLQNHEMGSDISYNKQLKKYSLSSKDDSTFAEILILLKLVIGTRSLIKNELTKIINLLLSFLPDKDKKKMNSLISSGIINYQPVTHGQQLLPLMRQFIFFIEKRETIDYHYVNSIDGTSKQGKGLPISIYFADFYFYILMYSEKYQCCYPYRLDRFSNVTKTKKKKIKLDYKKKIEDGVLRNKTYLLSGGKETTYTFRYWAFPQTALDRLPNSKVIKHFDDNSVLIEATSFEQGTLLWILSQGTFIKVLTPPSLVKLVKNELNKVMDLYK